MKSPPGHRAILAYFFTLLLVGAALVTLLVGWLYTRYASEVSAWHHVSEVHLVSKDLAGEILTRVESLRRVVSERATVLGEQHDASWLQSDLTSYLDIASVESALDSLEAIRLEAHEDVYGVLLESLRQRFDRFREAAESDVWTAMRFESELRAIRLTTLQFDRLHAIEADEALRGLIEKEALRFRGLVLVGLAVIVIGTVFAGRTLILLRKTLNEHLRVSEELLETEFELQSAQKLDAIGVLVGALSHDLNNLMLVIVGFSETLLEDAELSEGQQQDLEEIQKAGGKAAALTRQLSAFGRQEVDVLSVVDLNALVGELELFMRSLLRADISLAIELEPELGNVEANPVQAKQILLNLCLNARDAISGAGRVTVRTATAKVLPEDNRWPGIAPGVYSQLSVEDTGQGMSEDVRSRALEPFFTTNESGDSSGLGLATVHAIVEKSGGSVLLDSQVGRGTRVQVFLPSLGQPMAAKTDRKRQVRPQGGRETVLLVEDEPAIRRLILGGLGEAGYEVLEAENGEDAIDLCAEHVEPLDLILTDIVMPGLRGPELVERLRPIYPSVRVVYISGYSDEAVLDTISGSDVPLVTKPFKVDDLLEVVRRVLDDGRG